MQFTIHKILFAAAALSGCAGSGDGLDQNGRPTTQASSATALTADFDSIQDSVFTPICSVCHAGASAPHGLRLDEGNSYALLVGVASDEVPGLLRVNPSDPNSSYLVQKIQGTASVGDRMPLGGPYLPQTTIDVIRQWIANGAIRSTSVANAQFALADTGLRVVTTSPLAGARMTESVAQIIIGFDRELNVSLVNETTVSLQRWSNDTMTHTDLKSVAATISVPPKNPTSILITSRTPLANGTYLLTLRGSGGGGLAGVDAKPLSSTQMDAASESGEPTATNRDFAMTFAVEMQP
jgi:hypothetical protein